MSNRSKLNFPWVNYLFYMRDEKFLPSSGLTTCYFNTLLCYSCRLGHLALSLVDSMCGKKVHYRNWEEEQVKRIAKLHENTKG